MAVAWHFSEVARTSVEGNAAGGAVMDGEVARAKARGSWEGLTRGIRRPPGNDATAAGAGEWLVSES